MTGPAAYQSLPPAEDCQVGYRFISALASMNEKLGAFAGFVGELLKMQRHVEAERVGSNAQTSAP
ncbi:MAG: hypothetical protein WA730_01110 [Pseudolabrys sp.]